jgi:hypothetical protein
MSSIIQRITAEYFCTNSDNIIIRNISCIFVSCFRNYIADCIARVEGPHFAHRSCEQIKEGFNEILLCAQMVFC